MTQDSRVFFNHHVATAPPYQNIWDLREAYAQIGSSTEDWFDLIGDRQMLSFGDERVIGPTDWLNMGRTFDTARVDLHHPGFKVSIFASSVIIARDGVIDHHLEGNNLYGIYTSLTHFIPRATFEPFVLWRVAPGNVPLQENEGHGGLSEITGGARIADTFLGNFEYDVEMNKQTARSAFTRSTPRPQTGMPAIPSTTRAPSREFSRNTITPLATKTRRARPGAPTTRFILPLTTRCPSPTSSVGGTSRTFEPASTKRLQTSGR